MEMKTKSEGLAKWVGQVWIGGRKDSGWWWWAEVVVLLVLLAVVEVVSGAAAQKGREGKGRGRAVGDYWAHALAQEQAIHWLGRARIKRAQTHYDATGLTSQGPR